MRIAETIKCKPGATGSDLATQWKTCENGTNEGKGRTER